MNKKHLATVTILIKDRIVHAKDMNEMLTQNGHLILARLGVNVQKSAVEHCNGIITIVLEATASEISRLTKELDELYGVVAKSSIMTD